MEKTKQILFQVELEGNGIVNYDSLQQKWVYKAYENSVGVNKFSPYKNVKYAKKNFYVDSNNVLHEKIKISRDTLVKAIYEDNIIAHLPSITLYDTVFYNYLSSPASIMRGWLFASKTGGLKRKGCVSMIDAEQTSDTISHMETFAKQEYRPEKDASESKNEDDKGEANFFTSETCGDITYRTEGSIDLEFLQFISADHLLDRLNINPDKFDLFKSYYEQRFGKSDIKLDYYQTKTSIIDMSERGILLPEEHVKIIVKDFFERLTKLNIKRRNAYVRVKSVKIKLVNNPLTDTMTSSDGWIDLNTTPIDDIQYSIHEFYTLKNSDSHIEQNKKYAEMLKEKKRGKNSANSNSSETETTTN